MSNARPRTHEVEIARQWLMMASDVMALIDSDSIEPHQKERLADMLGHVAKQLQAAARNIHTTAIVEGLVREQDDTQERRAATRKGDSCGGDRAWAEVAGRGARPHSVTDEEEDR